MTDQTPEPAPAVEESAFDRAVRILRAPFPPEQIGMLPRNVKKDDPNKGPCEDTPRGRNFSRDGRFCGGWHSLSIHLDYVGHAALTARLLDADPRWDWEPVATDQYGLPLIVNGGLWIRLTVAGVTRLGYGDAPGKRDATKELIGDALRNAAMRFGAALDLWSKEDLRADDVERGSEPASGTNDTSGGQPTAGGRNGGQASAQRRQEAPAIDEDVRTLWRQRVLSIEYLGNKPKEAGPDGGLRTAYLDATKAGVLQWAVAPGQEETFLQLLQRLSRELPEWPDESKDEIPAGETDEQRVEREILEREREEIRRHEAEASQGDGEPPMALGNGWGADPGAGWGQPSVPAANGAHTR